LDLVEQAASQEEAVFVAFDFESASVDDQFGSLLDTQIDVASHFVEMLPRDKRAHFRRVAGARVDLQRLCALGKFLHQLVGDASHGYRNRDSHAALPCRTVGCADQRIDGLVEIGVRHDHQMILRAAEGLHTFAACGPGAIDVFGNWRGTHEAHCRDARIVQQRIDRHLVTMDYVEYAVGQSGFLHQLRQIHASRGVALRRLENECVAACDGEREHPHRHHDREIERRDARAYAEWLAHRVTVHPGADLFGVLTLEQMGNAAGKLDDFDSAGHFTPG